MDKLKLLMGGRVVTRPLDVPDYTLKVYWETPFSMTYGANVVIPLEIGFLTLRTSSFTLSNNDELFRKEPRLN